MDKDLKEIANEELGGSSSTKQKPLYKGRKISNFHIDVIRANIDKILSGELNTREVMALVNEEAIKFGETQIKSSDTIKKIIVTILADRPEELKKYYELVRHNSGKRNPYKGTVALRKVRGYRQYGLGLKKKIIDDYLPQLLSGEVTITMIEEELHTSRETIDAVIKEYYLKTDNEEGLKEYKEALKRNQGLAQGRKNAESKWEEIEKYVVVFNSEFLLLSEEEQDRQIVMKIRQLQLRERRKNNNRSVSTEDVTIAAVQRVKEYFRSKNDLEKGIEYFSEQDIRYIIFRYPTITSRDSQTLDEKIEVLTSYDEINEEIAYGMIKTFPTIMGYDAQRTKQQLDLLKRENLIGAVISRPSTLMSSVDLMYALIQFAKERKSKADLTDVNGTSIFMSNSSLKRAYGVSYEEIKKRFPYNISKAEQATPYSITGADLGQATYNSVNVKKSDEASKLVNQLLERGQTKGGAGK